MSHSTYLNLDARYAYYFNQVKVKVYIPDLTFYLDSN